MSADNWAECPECKQKAKDDHRKRLEGWQASYGKVSPQEYEDNRPAEKPNEVQETLREDYEVGIDEDHIFTLHYRASCSRCGFEYVKKIEELAVNIPQDVR